MVQDKKVRTFGVCFVDSTVGKVHVTFFLSELLIFSIKKSTKLICV
jgi:hypothetical protein